MSMKSLCELEIYASRKFGLGYPVEEYVKLSESDGDTPLGALRYLMKTCQMSFVMASHGIHDALAEDLLRLMKAPNVYVQLTLDNRCVADEALVPVHELAEYPSNSLAFTETVTDRFGVVDGLDTFDMTYDSIIVTRQPFVAARMRNKLDLLHEESRG